MDVTMGYLSVSATNDNYLYNVITCANYSMDWEDCITSPNRMTSVKELDIYKFVPEFPELSQMSSKKAAKIIDYLIKKQLFTYKTCDSLIIDTTNPSISLKSCLNKLQNGSDLPYD